MPFVAEHGSRLEELRVAVEPFTLDYVERRTGVAGRCGRRRGPAVRARPTRRGGRRHRSEHGAAPAVDRDARLRAQHALWALRTRRRRGEPRRRARRRLPAARGCPAAARVLGLPRAAAGARAAHPQLGATVGRVVRRDPDAGRRPGAGAHLQRRQPRGRLPGPGEGRAGARVARPAGVPRRAPRPDRAPGRLRVRLQALAREARLHPAPRVVLPGAVRAVHARDHRGRGRRDRRVGAVLGPRAPDARARSSSDARRSVRRSPARGRSTSTPSRRPTSSWRSRRPTRGSRWPRSSGTRAGTCSRRRACTIDAPNADAARFDLAPELFLEDLGRGGRGTRRRRRRLPTRRALHAPARQPAPAPGVQLDRHPPPGPQPARARQSRLPRPRRHARVRPGRRRPGGDLVGARPHRRRGVDRSRRAAGGGLDGPCLGRAARRRRRRHPRPAHAPTGWSPTTSTSSRSSARLARARSR